MQYKKFPVARHAYNPVLTALQDDTKWGALKAGQAMMDPKPIFAKIETEVEEKDQASPKEGKGGKKKARSKGLVEA